MAPHTDDILQERNEADGRKRIFEELKVGQLVMLKGREETYFFQVYKHIECYPPYVATRFVRCKTPGKSISYEMLEEDVPCVDYGRTTVRVLCPVDGSVLTECDFEASVKNDTLWQVDFFHDDKMNNVPDIVRTLYKGRLVSVIKDGEEIGIFNPVGHEGTSVQLEMCAYFGDGEPWPYATRGIVEIRDAFCHGQSYGHVWAEQFSDARMVSVSKERVAADLNQTMLGEGSIVYVTSGKSQGRSGTIRPNEKGKVQTRCFWYVDALLDVGFSRQPGTNTLP